MPDSDDPTQPMGEVPQGTPSSPPRPAGGGRGGGTPTWYIAAAGALLALVVVLVLVLVLRDDNGDDAVTDLATPTPAETPLPSPTPAPTQEPTAGPTATPGATPTPLATPERTPQPSATPTPQPSATPTSQPTAEPAPTSEPGAEQFVVWPRPEGVAYGDPVEAALGFAQEFAGFTDPIAGEYQAGDGRSGEVEIRPRADGPVTTVFVRQVGDDDTWSVLGAATENIVIDRPETLAVLDGATVVVEGEALAFEGTVDLELRVDGETDPWAEGFVTGGGDIRRPFAGELEFVNPGQGSGTLILFTRSAEDGAVWEVATVRVLFAAPS